MKESGLTFKALLVRAILDGSKTQTRSVVRPQPTAGQGMVNAAYCGRPRLWLRDGPCSEDDLVYEWRCPFGKPGDHIYVRETFAQGIRAMNAKRNEDTPFAYAANGTTQGRLGDKWRPAIDMPISAARLWLEITAVRVERLQSISEEDAEAEGVSFLRAVPGADETLTAKQLFKCLTDSAGGDWAANPWVWVIDFKRVDLTLYRAARRGRRAFLAKWGQ